VGSLVGQKGVRVMAVINELGGEKIDIIEWSDDPAHLISNALSPAKVLSVDLGTGTHEARVIVPHDELSLAIGKKGQNVRLAAKLTGWKIDLRSDTKPTVSAEMPSKNSEEDVRDQPTTVPALQSEQVPALQSEQVVHESELLSAPEKPAIKAKTRKKSSKKSPKE
jgi:hypothetical protein